MGRKQMLTVRKWKWMAKSKVSAPSGNLGEGPSLLSEDAQPIPSSSSHSSHKRASSEHTYCKKPPPNCTQENGDESAEQPVQSISPTRKRKRKNVIAEERKSKERRECLNLAVRENESDMSSFFDYLQAECSQIQDLNILVNLKTKLLNLVMESVKLDLSKRTDSTPSCNSLME